MPRHRGCFAVFVLLFFFPILSFSFMVILGTVASGKPAAALLPHTSGAAHSNAGLPSAVGTRCPPSYLAAAFCSRRTEARCCSVAEAVQGLAPLPGLVVAAVKPRPDSGCFDKGRGACPSFIPLF